MRKVLCKLGLHSWVEEPCYWGIPPKHREILCRLCYKYKNDMKLTQDELRVYRLIRSNKVFVYQTYKTIPFSLLEQMKRLRYNIAVKPVVNSMAHKVYRALLWRIWVRVYMWAFDSGPLNHHGWKPKIMYSCVFPGIARLIN